MPQEVPLRHGASNPTSHRVSAQALRIRSPVWRTWLACHRGERLSPDLPVDGLPDDVGVAVVPSGLLNLVQQDGSEIDLGAPWGGDDAVELRVDHDFARLVADRHIATRENLGTLLWGNAEVEVWFGVAGL